MPELKNINNYVILFKNLSENKTFIRKSVVNLFAGYFMRSASSRASQSEFCNHSGFRKYFNLGLVRISDFIIIIIWGYFNGIGLIRDDPDAGLLIKVKRERRPFPD